jgi:iron complex outermembrane receptor protein
VSSSAQQPIARRVDRRVGGIAGPFTPHHFVPALGLALGLAIAPASISAQTPAASLRQLSIEDLMGIEITSASRKEQRAGDAAAAVFVITHDDIRRSGMTTIPDLLRLAPGVDVAQVNANRWAVSVRGFNAVYANKLLVLIDGRSVYNRLFAGVFWDPNVLMVDDIERIEVIRGPGAATWGANAVNGVINIITMTAAETRGGLVRVDGGGAGAQGAVRYGGTVGTTSYRVFAQWNDLTGSRLGSGAAADDDARGVVTGFRADWARGLDALMLQGQVEAGRYQGLTTNLDPATAARQPVSPDPSDTHGGHALARWTHTGAGGAALQIQSVVDLGRRREPSGDYDRQAFDLDAQYHAAFGSSQDLVAGAGYRFIAEGSQAVSALSLIPANERSSLLTAFLQDEIALIPDRLLVTLGSQVQYDSHAGAGLQPTGRVMWRLQRGQRVWAAASRALRTPSFTELTINLDYPPAPTPSGLPLVVTLRGNADERTETFVDVETGYRLEIGNAASIDLTTFRGRYSHLQTIDAADPVVQFAPSPRILVSTQFGNQLAATTRGLEVAGHWMPRSSWRIDGSYTAFRLTPEPDAARPDAAAAPEYGDAPRSQWLLRSALSPTNRLTLSGTLSHVGRLAQFQVPAYTRADATAEWRFSNGLSAMVIGQNLLDDVHAEFSGSKALMLATLVERAVSLRLRWTFR